jgi:hypothetical protein
MICSNCETPFTLPESKALLLYQGAHVVAGICPKCTEGTLTIKVVLARNAPSETFAYDGYLPVSCVR